MGNRMRLIFMSIVSVIVGYAILAAANMAFVMRFLAESSLNLTKVVIRALCGPYTFICSAIGGSPQWHSALHVLRSSIRLSLLALWHL